MRSFLIISMILMFLGPTVGAAAIEEILSAKESSALRRVRERNLHMKIDRQTCVNQRNFRLAPLHCEIEVIERYCHGEISQWTIPELRLGLRSRGLSALCRKKLASVLEVKIYQAADFDDQELGLGLEDSTANGTRNSGSSGDLRTD